MTSELQKEFDHFLLSIWHSGNHRCGLAMGMFLERLENNCKPTNELTFEEIQATITGLGIQRVPTEDFFFSPIGVWLAAAYPDFFDLVAKTKDARTLDLSAMRFNAKAKGIQMQVNTTRGKRRDYVNMSKSIMLANAIARANHTPSGKNRLKGH